LRRKNTFGSGLCSQLSQRFGRNSVDIGIRFRFQRNDLTVNKLPHTPRNLLHMRWYRKIHYLTPKENLFVKE
jgi:hypothetical protein